MKGIYLTLALTKTFCDSCRGVGHSRWNCKSVRYCHRCKSTNPNRKTQPIHKTTNQKQQQQQQQNSKPSNNNTTKSTKTKTTKDNVGIIHKVHVSEEDSFWKIHQPLNQHQEHMNKNLIVLFAGIKPNNNNHNHKKKGYHQSHRSTTNSSNTSR